MLIKVSNLSNETSREDLFLLFGEFGEVETVKLMDSFQDGKDSAEAIIEMADKWEASEAIEQLDGERFDGKWIEVKLLNEEEDEDIDREDPFEWSEEEDWEDYDESEDTFFDDSSHFYDDKFR